MIDIHVHILPGIDDGAKDIEDFWEMARAAVAEGIHTIIATPHHLNNVYENPAEQIQTLVNRANQQLQEEDLPLVIYPGQEIHVVPELFQAIDQKTIIPLTGAGPYLLLELKDPIPDSISTFLYNLKLKGFIPIIAHAERYQTFRKDPKRLYSLVKQGVLVQLTAGSIVGTFGINIQKISELFIRHRLVHFIASDAHKAIGPRSFHMKAAYHKIKEIDGDMEIILKENAQAVLDKHLLYVDEPIEISKKKFFKFLWHK